MADRSRLRSLHHSTFVPSNACRRALLFRLSLLRLSGSDSEFEPAARAVVVDDHRLAVFDIALEQQPAQRSLELLLDRPFQRPGAVARIVTDERQVLARLAR